MHAACRLWAGAWQWEPMSTSGVELLRRATVAILWHHIFHQPSALLAAAHLVAANAASRSGCRLHAEVLPVELYVCAAAWPRLIAAGPRPTVGRRGKQHMSWQPSQMPACLPPTSPPPLPGLLNDPAKLLQIPRHVLASSWHVLASMEDGTYQVQVTVTPGAVSPPTQWPLCSGG